jgi:hypothetical protein
MGRQLLKLTSNPANPAGPVNNTTRGGPTSLHPFCFLAPLADVWGPAVSHPFFLSSSSPSPFQPPTPPRRAASVPRARMGWLEVSWPARRGLACARDRSRGIRPGEKTPLPSLGDAKGARPPLVWLHVGRCAMATNRSATFLSLPLHRLDQATIESPGVATASHLPALGFCPLSSAAPPIGERKKGVEEEEEERGKTVRRAAPARRC